jgi:hypothetical protein
MYIKVFLTHKRNPRKGSSGFLGSLTIQRHGKTPFSSMSIVSVTKITFCLQVVVRTQVITTAFLVIRRGKESKQKICPYLYRANFEVSLGMSSYVSVREMIENGTCNSGFLFLPLIHYNLGQNMSTVSLSSFFFLSSNTN